MKLVPSNEIDKIVSSLEYRSGDDKMVPQLKADEGGARLVGSERAKLREEPHGRDEKRGERISDGCRGEPSRRCEWWWWLMG